MKGIQSGCPAERAGLNNDDVVTHVDGHPIHDADGLRLQIGKLPAAATATLTLLRDGQLLQKRVALSKFPVDKRRIATQRPPAWRGIRVDYATAVDLTGGLNLLEPRGRFDRGSFSGTYVTVTEVEPGSPAANAGLKPARRSVRLPTRPLKLPMISAARSPTKSGP